MIALSIATAVNCYELLVDQRMLDDFNDSMEALPADKYILVSGKTRGETQKTVHFRIHAEDIEMWSWHTI